MYYKKRDSYFATRPTSKNQLESLVKKANKHYSAIYRIYLKAQKYGYTKPYYLFLEELKARATYQKLFSP